MKKIELLDPNKNYHIVRPAYLKDFYLSLNFYLLPKNVFIKKIILYINTKLLRKIKIIFNLILNISFSLKIPTKKNIVVFDDENFGRVLSNILTDDNYFVLITRIDRIKKIYISKKIIYYILKNFFKNTIKINYLCGLIEIIQPKQVITMIDMSNEFSKVALTFKNSEIKFSAVQAAHYQNINYKRVNIFIPNYYVFGNHEIKILKNNINVNNIQSVGSISAAVGKEYFDKNNIQPQEYAYDICFVCETAFFKLNSEYRHVHKDEKYDFYNTTKLLVNHVLKFCKKHNKKVIFSGKSDINNKLKNAEALAYKNLVDDKTIEVDFHKKSEFGNYKNIIQSKLVLGMNSSMLRESFEFKRKVLWCNLIDHEDTKSPSAGICEIKSKKYEDFESRLLEILNLNYEEYLSKINDVEMFYNTKIDTLEFLRDKMK